MGKTNCSVKITALSEDEIKIMKILDKERVRYKEIIRWLEHDEINDEDLSILKVVFEMNEKYFYRIRKKLAKYCATMEVKTTE